MPYATVSWINHLRSEIVEPRVEPRNGRTDAKLDGANLKGALMPDGSVHE